MSLTGKQKRHLRGLGTQLKSALTIGKKGITETVIDSAKKYLLANELLKCKVLDGDSYERRKIAEKMAEACDAELVQIIGKTFLLYKSHPEKPEIKLPE